MEVWEKAVITGYLLAGSWYDIRKKAVPLPFLALGGGAVFADVVFRGWEVSRLTALIPGILMLLLAKATNGIGEADGIVLLYIGFTSREKNILFLFGISLIYIFFYSMILFMRKRNRNIRIPYLPFLLAAYITMWKL